MGHAKCIWGILAMIAFTLMTDINICSASLLWSPQQQPPLDWGEEIDRGNMFYSPTIPQNNHTWAMVGNGFVGMVACNDTIFLGGLYNGNQTSVVHRARIPSTNSINVTNMQIVATALDIQRAIFIVRGIINDTETMANIELRWYAHRTLRSILVCELEVENLSNDTSTLYLALNSGQPSEDIGFKEIYSNINMKLISGNTLIPETNHSGTIQVAVASTPVPKQISVKGLRNETFYFITSVHSKIDTIQPERECVNDWEFADSAKQLLLHDHVTAWEDLWRSRITVDNIELGAVINASIYALFSSVRPDYDWSIAPEGLPTDVRYYGQIFWDADFWMFPPLLLINPWLSTAIINYRYNVMKGAAQTANFFNYDGLMFPWESGYTGVEICYDIAKDCWIEVHLPSDVCLSYYQYWCVTNDTVWLENVGWPVFEGVAKYWASRVTWNDTQNSYVLNDVRCVDEYADHVNNCVFTNAIASMSLQWATKFGNMINKPVPASWMNISNLISIPFNESNQIHLEYDGYNGEIIKQADVVLLSFPLNYPMSEQVRQNDIEYYTKRTNPFGPAMTFSMETIDYLILNNTAKAAKTFNLSYKPYVQKPYNVWWEKPNGGGVNFLTGVGGFLQGIMFGYGGIRIHEQNITISPIAMMPNVTDLQFHSIHFMQNVFSLQYEPYQSAINVTISQEISKNSQRHCNLYVNQQILNSTIEVTVQNGDSITVTCSPLSS